MIQVRLIRWDYWSSEYGNRLLAIAKDQVRILIYLVKLKVEAIVQLENCSAVPKRSGYVRVASNVSERYNANFFIDH